MCYRFIGFGVQGFVDVFILLGMLFDFEEVQQLNRDIFEIIYYYVLKILCELVVEEGVYEIYVGFLISKGVLQLDMWNVKFLI